MEHWFITKKRNTFPRNVNIKSNKTFILIYALVTIKFTSLWSSISYGLVI